MTLIILMELRIQQEAERESRHICLDHLCFPEIMNFNQFSHLLFFNINILLSIIQNDFPYSSVYFIY